jgi:cytochrome c oxidase assembly factor CtaG
MRAITLALLSLLFATNTTLAHGVETHGQPSWTWDPWVVIPLLMLGLAYLAGSALLWLRSATSSRAVRSYRALAFIGGWFTLGGALVSPLHWLGEHLFTFHMIEHEILMAVSAPLLVLARPIGMLLWSLPRRSRVSVGRLLRRPLVSLMWRWLTTARNATLIHGVAIWAWHAPAVFDAALGNVVFHRLQHLSFLVTAVLFWWSMLRRSNAAVAAWHLFITMLHMSVLGALMALAPRVLYETQTAAAASWGLTPLEDQQLAGIIMWVPAGTVYAGAVLALTTIWIRHASRTGRVADARGL